MSARADDRRRAAAHALGYDRLSMFVPAVMSVGLLFWVVSELRELLRHQHERRRRRRAQVAARTVVDRTLGRAGAHPLEELGLRPRPVYLLLGLTLAVGGVYVAVGSIANYRRDGGYVSSIAWLLALALAVTLLAGLYGAAALAAFARYPTLPLRTRRLTLGSALTTEPVPAGSLTGRPHWAVTAALTFTTGAAALLSLVVAWSPHVVRSLDRTVARWLAGHRPPAAAAWLDPVGTTEVAVAITVVAALAALRCRVLVTSLVLSLGAALAASVLVRPLVARPRPGVGGLDSYPSGHALLGTLLAGLVPLAVAEVLRRPRLVAPLRALLGAAVVAGAAHRVADGRQWPTDAVGGALMGLALVLAVEWAVRTERSHARCHGCPWGPTVARAERRRGLVPIHGDAVRLVRFAAHLAAAGAAAGLAVLTMTVDVPRNPEGAGLGAAVERPAQLALAGLVSIGALVAWRWPGTAAVLIAFAATGLGVFASVEYPPAWALALAGALLVPAVLLWLSWQHRRHHGEIVALAAVTALLLGTTWFGSRRVYDHYFGPTHPASTAVRVAVDRVEWVWLGALAADGVSVSARLDGAGTAAVVATPDDGGPTVRSPAGAAGTHDVVSLRLDGLRPGTGYRYVVEVDGAADEGRGRGSFRTPAAGAASFRVAVASCARTGSNGAVFDAIRAADPLLYLQLGDLHYENLTSTSPGAFLEAYDRALDTPAQGALARQVPTAYVWDDHDFGPNDAGADSPTREAVRAAYDVAFPHYPLVGATGPISQAFTIGRVRFVVTDGRSARTADTLLGAEQEAWLVREVVAASRTHALVVWANGTPWIGAARPGADTWAGYAAERTRIADALAAAGVDDLVMVSGDAHMVAIDDGTNSGYATDGTPGFPVLQAAPLDRPGSAKGGPYSEGGYVGSGQFGLVDVVDTGGATITVRLSGHTWDGRELVAFERTFAV